MRYNIFADNNISPLKIGTIGFSGDSAVTKFGPGQRNLYIIHYVTKGKGCYNGNLVTAGQGFLIYPGQLEEYYGDAGDQWEFLWIISADSAMREIFDRYNADPNTLIFDYASVSTVKKIADKIIVQNNEIVDSLKMLEMFLHIFNSHTSETIPLKHKPNSEIYMDFCIDYIESNIYKRITVEELSMLLGISQPYLYRLFKNKFNMSAKEYIDRHKIDHAKKLLIETDMSITEIANSVGYNDILTFSKFFSQKEKVSPKKYRQLASSSES